MANFDTGLDILRHFLRRAGDILPTSTAEADADHVIDAKLYVTQAYWSVLGMQPWRFGRKDPPVQFASVASDAVTVNTISGATVTLSATLSPSRAGRKFFIDSEGIPHRISAHIDGSDILTLVTAYTGDLTSGAGTIFQDEFTVATDILGFVQIKDLNQGQSLEIISEREFNEIAPRNIYGVDHTSKRYGTFLTDSKLRISPWTSVARLFEAAYSYRPAPLDFSGNNGADTPILPQHARAILSWKGLEMLLRDREEVSKADKIRDGEVAEFLTTLRGLDLTFNRNRTFVPRGHRISG